MSPRWGHFPCVEVAAVLDVPGVEQRLCGECLAARELGAAKTAVPFFSQGQWRQSAPKSSYGLHFSSGCSYSPRS